MIGADAVICGTETGAGVCETWTVAFACGAATMTGGAAEGVGEMEIGAEAYAVDEGLYSHMPMLAGLDATGAAWSGVGLDVGTGIEVMGGRAGVETIDELGTGAGAVTTGIENLTGPDASGR